MAATATDSSVLLSDGKEKNRIVITLPGNDRSHFAYAVFFKNKKGRLVMRPAIPERDRRAADFIRSTMFCPHINHLLCYGFAIDLDSHRCESRYKIFQKIDEDKIRTALVEELGETAASRVKMVRSRSGQGIHLWVYFPPFPLNGKARDAQDLAEKIQAALVELMRPFGADPQSIGLDRWAANWKNESNWIDRNLSDYRVQCSRGKTPVLTDLYQALKKNPKTISHFVKELTRFYPDVRVSSKIAELVADHFEDLSLGKDLVFSRSALLKAMPISKTTLPSLLSSVVGPKNPWLRGIIISRDPGAFGFYRVSIDSEFWRVKHLAEAVLTARRLAAQKKKRSPRGTSTVMVFRATPLPEDVLDGERNNILSLVAIKLRWSGVEESKAERVLAAYAARIPGAQASLNVSRQDDILKCIYGSVTHKTFGCRPGMAESWLLNIGKKAGSSPSKSNYTKSPLGELQCPALTAPGKKTPDFAEQHFKAPAADKVAAGKGSEEKEWLKRSTAKGLIRNLSSVMSMDGKDEARLKADRLSKKLSMEAQPAPAVPLSTRLSARLRTDPRFTSEQKQSILGKILLLRAARGEELLTLARRLWPGEKWEDFERNDPPSFEPEHE